MSETTTAPAPVPEAIRLAAWLNEGCWHQIRLGDVEAAGRELRRLHAENVGLRAVLAAAATQLPVPPAEPAVANQPERLPIDANALEAMARERPNDMFLKGSGVLKLTGAIRQLEAKVRALHAAPPTPLWPVDQIASDVCQAVAELGDRNSPEGQPAMMLVTAEELFDAVKESVNAATQPPQEAPPTDPESHGERLTRLLREADAGVSSEVSEADALEFHREQCGLTASDFAVVLSMQQSHYSEVVHQRRRLPINAVARAVAIGVPAAPLLAGRTTPKESSHV